MLYLIGQEDDGTNEIHTQVKIFASKCLGNCCHQYVKSQRNVTSGPTGSATESVTGATGVTGYLRTCVLYDVYRV